MFQQTLRDIIFYQLHVVFWNIAGEWIDKWEKEKNV